MTLRTAVIIRHICFGLMIGFVVTAVSLRQNVPSSSGALIGQIVGGLLGGAAVVGLIGYVRARRIAADARVPPLSAARRALLVFGLAVIVLALVLGTLVFRGVIRI